MMTPRAGDAILYPVTPHSSWTSKLVAIGEIVRGMGKGEVSYSHVAARAEDEDEQYEAKWPVAGRFRIDRSRIYEVWRIGDPSLAQQARALNWWSDHRGDRYNMLGLLTIGFLGLPHQEVCSQFYAAGWAAAGLHISREGQRLVSPNAIADHPSAHLIARYVPRVGRVL